MFEYWFLGDESHTGETNDFLEVLCQIAQHFDPEIAGKFVEGLLDENLKELAFLRVIDWKFDFKVPDIPLGQTIRLIKHR